MILIDNFFLKKALKNNNASFDMCNKIFAKHISIDSRSIKKNSLFIAIKGKKFDGHNFINKAFKNNACAVIASNFFKKKIASNKNLIFVDNTLLALQKIAENFLKNKKIFTIAVTGSNGKTTTKELIGHALNYALGKKKFLFQKIISTIKLEFQLALLV